MHQFEVNMDEYLPLRDVVFKTLRQAILKGELEPGERLMEIQLAERLGVSRTPIREAIRKLELEGLVLMIPRRGAEVAKISEKNLRDVLEVRRSLEELAIDLACQRIQEEELETLREAQKEFAAAVAAGHLSRRPDNISCMASLLLGLFSCCSRENRFAVVDSGEHRYAVRSVLSHAVAHRSQSIRCG